MSDELSISDQQTGMTICEDSGVVRAELRSHCQELPRQVRLMSVVDMVLPDKHLELEKGKKINARLFVISKSLLLAAC